MSSFILSSHLDSRAESTLSKFSDDTKPERAANTPENSAAIQHKLSRLKKWSDRDLMKFNKGKYKAMNLGRRNHMQQRMLGNS